MRRFLVKTLNLMILVLFLTGCSALEQKMGAYKSDQLNCSPVTSLGNECEGFLVHDKLIIEERDL